ncbi:MAG TPA: hydrogenase maturation nickel metallochaperone HypA [Acidimicrobiales bacterium]|nr:hydrogenase maturation nickel metallochaperone HypA [Acidimicrobiales bacterium]
MHELGLCADIVGAVTRRAGDRPVARVTVRVGALHHVHPEAFAQSFALAAAGTSADGAVAELVLVPMTMRCRACGSAAESVEPVVACPACGAPEVDQRGGDELVLESLEYRA